jgi:hypothetical protein
LYCEDDVHQRVKEVARWNLDSTENFLKSMLINRQDVIISEFSSFYASYADDELLQFAINNSNQLFLKYALKNSIFEVSGINHPEMIQFILIILKQGTKIELVLNVLIYADFSRWR